MIESSEHEEEQGLLAALEDRSLPTDRFTHRRHLHLAWLYLRRYGFPAGAVRFVETLRAYVAHHGVPQKYHETMTWAYVVLLNEELCLRAPAGETFEQLMLRRPDLLSHRNGPLFRYYSAAQLDGEEARRVFVLPYPPRAA